MVNTYFKGSYTTEEYKEENAVSQNPPSRGNPAYMSVNVLPHISLYIYTNVQRCFT